MKRAILALALLAGGAQAQTLPAFDETLGYEVVGTISDGLVVTNAGRVFHCRLGSGLERAYLTLKDCAPILGADAVAAYQLAEAQAADSAAQDAAREIVAEAPGDEQKLLAALNLYSDDAVKQQVAAAMRAQPDCAMDVGSGEGDTRFGEAILARVLADLGYEGTLSDHALQQIKTFLVSDAVQLMVDAGTLAIDQSEGVWVRLADCAEN